MQESQGLESLASVDSNGNTTLARSNRVQPDRSVVLGEVSPDQLTRWCCIDRLSSHMFLGNRQLSRLRVNQDLASLPNLEVAPLSDSGMRP
jgi:hypothetical protein